MPRERGPGYIWTPDRSEVGTLAFGGGRSVEDGSFADNHRFTADPNFLENSCTA